MENDEANAFESESTFEMSILMRKWDELAKETNVPVIDLKEIKHLVRKVLKRSFQ